MLYKDFEETIVWKHVKNTLPPHGRIVLLCNEYSVCSFLGMFNGDNGKFYDSNCLWLELEIKVDYWTELPEGYFYIFRKMREKELNSKKYECNFKLEWRHIDSAPEDEYIICVWEGFNFENPVDSEIYKNTLIAIKHDGQWKCIEEVLGKLDYCNEPKFWMPLTKNIERDDDNG